MTARIVVFYYKDGENKSVRQICETEMFLFVDILCNIGPRVDVLCIVSKNIYEMRETIHSFGLLKENV